MSKYGRLWKRGLLLLALSAFLIGAIVPHAIAENTESYPNRSIRLIVPYAAGGGTDAVARAIGQVLTTKLGQPVVVVNMGAGGGNVATQTAAAADPDGYTILMANQGPIAINPHLIKSFNVDTLAVFDPICLVAVTPLVLVVNNQSKFHTVKDLVDFAKANPGKLTYGTAGIGSASHLAAEVLNESAGIKTIAVPYRGAAPAVTDLMGQRTDFMITPLSSLMAALQSKQIRPIGIAAKRRVPQFPDVPTIAESGVPKFDAGDGAWYGIVVPKGTPAAVVGRLNAAIVAGIGEPLLSSRLATDGAASVGSTPEELGAFMKAESDRWSAVISKAGLQVD